MSRANLIVARDVVAKPGGWTQNSIARTIDGRACLLHDEDACSFCVTGAMVVAGCSILDRGLLVGVIRVTGKKTGLTTWNDAKERTQAEAVALFDAAIAASEISSSRPT